MILLVATVCLLVDPVTVQCQTQVMRLDPTPKAVHNELRGIFWPDMRNGDGIRDRERVAPLRRAIDLDRIGRHPPALGAGKPDAVRHG